MALETVEISGAELAFNWPDTLDMLLRGRRARLSDFGIGDMASAIHSATKHPEGKEAQNLRVLQKTLIAVMGQTPDGPKGRLKRDATGDVVMEEKKLPNGRVVHRPVWEPRTRFGLNASEVATRLKKGVNGEAGQYKKWVENFDMFLDLASKMKFFSENPNAETPLSANDEQEFKRLHELAKSDTDPIRAETLGLIKSIRDGKYEEKWDGIN
jgi:hypothetical protein